MQTCMHAHTCTLRCHFICFLYDIIKRFIIVVNDFLTKTCSSITTYSLIVFVSEMSIKVVYTECSCPPDIPQILPRGAAEPCPGQVPVVSGQVPERCPWLH